MDWLTSLTDAFGDDGIVVLALLVLSGTGLLALLAAGFLHGRSDIRRRTSEGMDERSASRAASGARGDANASLHRLAKYLETTFGGSDPHEKRVIRLQLIQAGFFDQRAIAAYFAARLASAMALGIGTALLVPLLRPDTTATNLWLSALGLGIVGYFAPNFYLRRRIARRADEHRMG